MKILALDVGTKRIGLAVSDDLLITAQGMDTIECSGPDKDMERIASIVEENRADEIVVGLPLNMNGTESKKTKEVLAFVERLILRLKIPVKTWDERLTSVQADRALLGAADALYAKVREAMDKQALTKYLDAVWAVVGDANRYFAAEEPWAKKKTDPKRMETILYVAAEIVRQVAILAQPVTPDAAAKLLDYLGQPAEGRTFSALGEAGRLVPGIELPEPSGVFPRYVAPEAEGGDKPEPKPKKDKANKAPKGQE